MSWLQTRESSTLVIVTFLASASLLLLTVPQDNNLLTPADVPVIGFWFASFGLLYRQITVWTVDRIQHNREVDRARNDTCQMDRERRQEILFGRNNMQVYFVYALVREFFVLLFISMPVALWLHDGCLPHHVCTYVFMPASIIHEHLLNAFPSVTSVPFKAILLSATIAFILSSGDLICRIIDRHLHPARN